MFLHLLQRSNPWLALLFLAAPIAKAHKADPLPPDVPAVECKPPVALNFDGLRVFSGKEPVLMTFHCGVKGSEATACHAEYLTLSSLTNTRAISSLRERHRVIGPAPWLADGPVGHYRSPDARPIHSRHHHAAVARNLGQRPHRHSR